MELNSNKRISVNVIFSVLQVGIVGLIYLIVYKLLLSKLGAEQLGIWSLILATTSVANLANFGITSGIVKFVAEYYSESNFKNIQKVIFTSFISLLFFFVIISVFIFPILKYFLSFFIETEYYDLAMNMLPISLISLIINSVSGVFSSALEGIQKNYSKNILLIISTIVFLISIYFLTDKYGLLGAAYSQLIQALFLLITSFLLVAIEFKSFLILKSNWDTKIFKKITGFGLKFQFISVLVILFDPITKALLSKFGGLSFLGYYEMANKLIYQIRAVIINANQVMIPVIVHTKFIGKERLNDLYVKNLNLTFMLSLLLMTSLIILTPIISLFWIGKFNDDFMFCMYFLSIAVFINILNSPAYFASIAHGNLGILVKSHLIMSFLNIVLSSIFGYYFGGRIIVITYGLSLIIGSLYLIIYYHLKIGVKRSFLLTKKNILLLILSIILACFSLLYKESLTSVKTNLYLILTTILYLIILFTIHTLLLYTIFKKGQTLKNEIN
jgi:O-antigen/teichoic acid export membrane protein